MTHQALLDLMQSIPYFATYSDKLLASAEFTLLPSNTNKTYKVRFKQHTNEFFIIKTPKKTTNGYVNRNNEKHNTTIAFNLALTAEPLWFGDLPQQQGMSLSRYLTNCRKLVPSDLKQAATINRVAKSLKILQSSHHDFMGNFSEPCVIRNYLDDYYGQCANELQNKLSNNFIKAQLALDQIDLLNLPINNPVPSHMDLMADNILIQTSSDPSVWLIDWEYSAMASPYWDIATLCNVANLNQHKAKGFLFLILNKESGMDEAINNLNNYRLIVRSLVECWRGAFVQNKK